MCLLSFEQVKNVPIEISVCREYKINQEDNAAGIPGILIGANARPKTSQLKTYLTGRYPNDSYAGGNPWQVNIKMRSLFKIL